MNNNQHTKSSTVYTSSMDMERGDGVGEERETQPVELTLVKCQQCLSMGFPCLHQPGNDDMYQICDLGVGVVVYLFCARIVYVYVYTWYGAFNHVTSYSIVVIIGTYHAQIMILANCILHT